uniref:Uncharacterized protein n=1 Tax=Cacopsylla melanoneura TaxID=428564 RepID=A0A8D9EAL3_9HEMI
MLSSIRMECHHVINHKHNYIIEFVFFYVNILCRMRTCLVTLRGSGLGLSQVWSFYYIVLVQPHLISLVVLGEPLSSHQVDFNKSLVSNTLVWSSLRSMFSNVPRVALHHEG